MKKLIIYCSWEFSLFVKGWKKVFTEDDLYEPLEEYESKHLTDKFEQLWLEEIKFREKPSLWRIVIKSIGLEFMTIGILYFLVDTCVSLSSICREGCYRDVPKTSNIDIYKLHQYSMMEKDVSLKFCHNNVRRLWDEFALRRIDITRSNVSWTSQRALCYVGQVLANQKCLGGVSCFSLLQTIYMRKLIDYYTPAQSEIREHQAYWYSAYIVLLSFLRVLVYHYNGMQLSVCGMKIRVACSSLMYRKLLKLKNIHILNTTTGHIVNLLSNDVRHFDFLFLYMHYIWYAPVQMIIVGYYLDITINHIALAGFCIIFVFVLIQFLWSKSLSDYVKQTTLITDYRIRLMDDIIHGIKVIKIFAWEQPFAHLVNVSRKLELNQITKVNIFRVLQSIYPYVISKLSMSLFLLSTVLSKFPLTPQNVYVVETFYEIVKTKFVILIVAIFSVCEANISVQRIQNLLTIDEEIKLIKKQKLHKTEGSFILKSTNYQNREIGIHIEKVTAKWNISSPNHTLSEVNFYASSGELIGIIGECGSGKSTLLHTILQENIICKGTLDVKGTISYASQDSWIFSSNIRQNILFGGKMDEIRYFRVIKACALEYDLSMFPHGDKTLVGERGVMLSGGQRARINLARAVYKEADIYLLDDPLSAVDSQVGQQIFSECIQGFLKDKCVVLVTHQLQYLQHFTKVYVVENGKVILNKEYEQLETISKKIRDKIRRNSFTAETLLQQQYPMDEEVKEHRSVGYDVGKVYKYYFLFAGKSLVCSILFLLVFSRFIIISNDYFLNIWINLEQGLTRSYEEFKEWLTPNNCLYIYISLTAFGTMVMFLTLFLAVYMMCKNASNFSHDKMLSKILLGTVKFFNEHSSGRILNRFSNDLGIVDQIIPTKLFHALINLICIIGTWILISVINYWTVGPFLILFGFLVGLGFLFYPINKNFKRTESLTRSPIFTHVSASLKGLTTIKALNAEKILEQEFDHHQNIHSTAYHLSLAVSSAFGFWADMLCTIYVTIVVFSIHFFKSGISPAIVGLTLSQVFAIAGYAQYILKEWGELDIYMTSFERILEYTKLTPEADDGTAIPPETWPNAGNLSFHSVCMRYSPKTTPVLKQISFQVHSGEKIGIIGRTGAGKSSLISVLFRLFDFEGRVIIDEIDTKTIPLKNLRSKISVIPQEPVLFLGTLRNNLDPFDRFTDSQIWNVLEEVGLKNMVSRLPSGIDTTVSEGGSNFSVGERQLLCLGRTLLQSAKIVILDEATANVDLKTDKIIRRTIKEKFKDCTVLTIAHRLDTVTDSDKILVIDDGSVVEFDHPDRLLENPEGVFYNFWNKGCIK